MAAEEKKEGGVVAQVNGQPISSSDYDSAMNAAKQQFAGLGGQEGDKEQLQKLQNLTLDRLIDFELLYQASQKEKVNVDENAIKEKLSAYKKQFSSDAEFQTFLSTNKLTEEVMQTQLRRKMAIEGLQQKLYDQFTAGTKVTDEELQQFYDSNKDNIKQPEKVRASHILVAVESTADDVVKKAAMEKIKGIQKKLKDGGDFAQLAQESSDCPSKANGGDLDFFLRQQMVKPFSDAAFSTPVGQITDIVTTEFGYHLIKVTDKQPEKLLTFDEVKEKISTYLSQQKIDDQFEAYIKGLRDQADIKRMLPAQNS
ncbi:MAG: peptidylprolyl isomerase [Desulfobulbaceae bacterium]|nr:peptidylprolyl isomerase [Desulfobulbaceae bacterium]